MGIGIGLQRKGRDMSKLKYLIDGKADEQFENMLWCFGGGDPDSDDSGGDSGSSGGRGDSAFYDNERPGMTRTAIVLSAAPQTSFKAPHSRVMMAGLTPQRR